MSCKQLLYQVQFSEKDHDGDTNFGIIYDFSKPKNCFNSCRKNVFIVKRGESQRESCDSLASRGQMEEEWQQEGREGGGKEGRKG